MRHAIASILLACSLAVPAAAQDIPPVPLPAQAQQSQTKNPFLWPGIAIMAGGAVMAVYGYSADTYLAGGAAVAGGSNGIAVAAASPGGSVSMGGVGVAVAALGGLVIYIGHLEARKGAPMVVIGARRVSVSIPFGR